MNEKNNSLIELCNYAKKNSQYYKKLYNNFSIKTIEDFFNLPFSTSEMYYENYDNLKTMELTGKYTFSTGGSTGAPKYIYLSYDELHLNIKCHGSSYKKAGIASEDRVAIFGMPGLLTSEFTVYLGLEQTGCFILPIGIFEELEKIVNLLKEFKINTLLLMPTDVIILANYCKEKNLQIEIKKIITGGEPLTISMKEYIKSIFKDVVFGSTYQSMDFGTIGYRTEDLLENEFIINNKYQFLEVIDEKGNKVQEGVVGELIVTNLSRRLLPVIRYKTGDLVKIIDSHLFIIGRLANIPKIGGEKFQANIIEEYLKKDSLFTGRYQYIIDKKDYMDFILLKLEIKDLKVDEEKLKQEIREFILLKQPKLKNQIKNRAIHNIEINFLLEKNNEFILTPNTGKLKNLIDRRQKDGF